MSTKQNELPGIERPVVQEVEDAAQAYAGIRDKRIKALKKEVAAKEALIAAMRAHSLDVYRLSTAVHAVLVALKEGKTKRDGRGGGGRGTDRRGA